MGDLGLMGYTQAIKTNFSIPSTLSHVSLYLDSTVWMPAYGWCWLSCILKDFTECVCPSLWLRSTLLSVRNLDSFSKINSNSTDLCYAINDKKILFHRVLADFSKIISSFFVNGLGWFLTRKKKALAGLVHVQNFSSIPCVRVLAPEVGWKPMCLQRRMFCTNMFSSQPRVGTLGWFRFNRVITEHRTIRRQSNTSTRLSQVAHLVTSCLSSTVESSYFGKRKVVVVGKIGKYSTDINSTSTLLVHLFC
jgi:hypothetical protein